MAPIHASPDEAERGQRLAEWLERVGPQYPKYLRGEKIFRAPRQTVESWIKGADISNEGVCRILEVGGVEALAWILGVKVGSSRGESAEISDKVKIHDKGIRFWYAQYVRERMKTIFNKAVNYSDFPVDSQEALKKADALAELNAKALLTSGTKKPRIKKYDFPK